MNRKNKGISAERELIHKFWDVGWAAFRAAGSGSMKYPSPDVIAGNVLRKLAIECKSLGGNYKHFQKKEIRDLIEFARTFGAEPWIAIRFSNEGWFFINPEDLNESEKGFTISLNIARNKGLLFDEVIK
jgi:Holliday junction resolvase